MRKAQHAAGLVLLLVISGCSSALSSGRSIPLASTTVLSPGVLDTGGAGTTASAVATDTAQAGPRLTPIVVKYAAADGTAVTVTFALSAMMHADDPRVVATLDGDAPCEADQQRDGVSVGTLTVQNTTPEFNADVAIAMFSQQAADGEAATLNFGAQYSDGAQCSDLNGANAYGAMQPAVNLHMSSADWGPAPIEFVVHGLYSPSSPGGDQGVLMANRPVIDAFEGTPADGKQYSIVSTDGPTGERIQGSVPLLLDALPK